MDESRFAVLTDAQREYLRSVGAGLTSKQIAQQRGGSHHTVNAEIAIAVRVLGANTRADAAAMLDRHERAGSYDRSYDPPAVVDATISAAPSVSGGEHRTFDGFPLPIPTTGRPLNALGFWQRTMWILVIAAITALVMGGLITGITAQLDGLGRRI